MFPVYSPVYSWGCGSPHSLRHNNACVCAQSALPSVSLTFVTNMNTKGVNVAIIFTILREGAFFLFNAFTLHTILSILTCFLPIKLERLCLIVCIKNSVLSNRFLSRRHYWATSFSIVSIVFSEVVTFLLSFNNEHSPDNYYN